MTPAEITAAKIAFADRILSDLENADPKFWAGEFGLTPTVATVGEVPASRFGVGIATRFGSEAPCVVEHETGEGDSRLRLIRCGAEYAIETNGSPIFEGDSGWDDAMAILLG